MCDCVNTFQCNIYNPLICDLFSAELQGNYFVGMSASHHIFVSDLVVIVMGRGLWTMNISACDTIACRHESTGTHEHGDTWACGTWTRRLLVMVVIHEQCSLSTAADDAWVRGHLGTGADEHGTQEHRSTWECEHNVLMAWAREDFSMRHLSQ